MIADVSRNENVLTDNEYNICVLFVTFIVQYQF